MIHDREGGLTHLSTLTGKGRFHNAAGKKGEGLQGKWEPKGRRVG